MRTAEAFQIWYAHHVSGSANDSAEIEDIIYRAWVAGAEWIRAEINNMEI